MSARRVASFTATDQGAAFAIGTIATTLRIAYDAEPRGIQSATLTDPGVQPMMRAAYCA